MIDRSISNTCKYCDILDDVYVPANCGTKAIV
jgi:hypothetical protein